MRKTLTQISLILLIVSLLLSACQGASAPTAPAGQPPSATPAPTSSPTPQPTATNTPLPTSTSTPTPTPTPALPAAVGTPLSFTPPALSLENAKGLRELKHWGRGVSNKIRLSPDGKTLLAAFATGLGAFDAQTLEQTHWVDLKGFTYAISHDGKLVAGASGDTIIHVWDAASGEELHTFKGHQEKISALAFTPDGSLLVSGAEDKNLKLWSLEEGKAIKTLEGHESAISALDIDANGFTLASGDTSGEMRLWNLEDGELVRTIKTSNQFGPILALVYSPDGGQLAVTNGLEDSVKVWSASTGRSTAKLVQKNTVFTSLAFSPDGEVLAAGTLRGPVKLFSLKTSKVVGELTGPMEGVDTLLYYPDGQTIVTSADDGSLRLWNVEDGAQTVANESGMKIGFGLTLLPDGKSFVIGAKQNIYKMSLENGELLQTMPYTVTETVANTPESRLLSTLFNALSSVVFSPDGSRFLARSLGDGEIQVFSFPEGQLVQKLANKATGSGLDRLFGAFITSAVFSPDSQRLAAGSLGGQVRVWKLGTEDDAPEFVLKDIQGLLTKLAFSPDGKLLAAGAMEGGIQLWNMEDGSAVRSISGHKEDINALAFSPDGKLLASASKDKTVHITSLEDGSLLQELKGHEGGAQSVAFSPDGKIVAVGSAEGQIILWNVDDGEQLGVFEGHSAQVRTLIFTPDGQYLISESTDGTIRVWGIVP